MHHHAGAHYAGANHSARAYYHAACHHSCAAYHHPRAAKPTDHATYDDVTTCYNVTYYHNATTHNYDPAAHHHDGRWRAGARPRPADAGWRVS